ncbi:MAG TPA: lytic transglycosylase domain-containing protein [Blastocatellia bacterium]|nr:lytic transglycosylase domain-containing protein [Blastocatellia bacterium]
MKKTAVLFILLIAPSWAAAQDRPLSPPARPPVPLTNSDQERADEMARKKAEAAKAPVAQSPRVSVPAALAGAHISSGNAVLDALVAEAARQNGLDPCLILSLMRQESGFNQRAVSRKGASGLMQLMPETASRFGVKDIFDPRENVLAGSKYLRWLLDRFNGDVRLALAGYNAGEGAVEFYGNRIPPFLETQNYVRLIYARYVRIHSAPTTETTVAETPKPVEQLGGKIPTYNQIIRLTATNGDTARAPQ